MHDHHEKPPPGPAREVDPRDDVHVAGSPVRCPFCHDDVAIEGEWSACARCLARHHQPCWGEGARCAACGHAAAIRHERADPQLSGRAALLVVLFCAALALMVISFAGQLMSNRPGKVVPASEPPPPPARVEPKPASRYERDGALVVDDGRGNFVAVFEAADEVVFGFGVVLDSLDADRFVVLRPDGEPWVTPRPVHYPLTVFRSPMTADRSSRRGRMTAQEIADILRRTSPSELIVDQLLARVLRT